MIISFTINSTQHKTYITYKKNITNGRNRILFSKTTSGQSIADQKARLPILKVTAETPNDYNVAATDTVRISPGDSIFIVDLHIVPFSPQTVVVVSKFGPQPWYTSSKIDSLVTTVDSQGDIQDESNIIEDPLFSDLLNNDFNIQSSSPCINSGSNDFVEFETDFEGKIRIVDGLGGGNATVDIGAFEYGSYCYSFTEDVVICDGESYLDWTQSVQYSRVHSSVAGCDSVIITNLLVSEIPETPTISQHGDTLISSSETGNQWYLDGNKIPGAVSKHYIYTQNGQYHVQIINEHNCTSLPSQSITIINTSVDDLIGDRIRIFPNPTKKDIFITGLPENELTEIKIYDANGVLQKMLKVSSNEILIEAEDLSPGLYFIVLNNQREKVRTVVKE